MSSLNNFTPTGPTQQEEVLSVHSQAESLRGATEAPFRRAKPAAARETLKDVGLRVGSIVTLVFAWWVTSLFFPPTLVPRPWDTFAEVSAIVSTGNFFIEMGSTLRRVLVGFGIAMVVRIPLGILMGTLRSLESFFEPPVILGLTMPGLIWAVLMIMFFGLTETSAYAAVAVTIFPMLAISIWQGTKAIDKDLIDMSEVFHASAWSKVVDVILPQLVSHLLAAIRYGLGLAWKVVRSDRQGSHRHERGLSRQRLVQGSGRDPPPAGVASSGGDPLWFGSGLESSQIGSTRISST